MRRLILGPPGTGKTTRLLDIAEEWIDGGLPPEMLGFATYTRAARSEAASRFHGRLGLGAKDIPWLRTIHSSMSRCLGLSKADYISDSDLRDWCKTYRYDLAEDGDEAEPMPHRRGRDAGLARHLERGRALMQSDSKTSAQIRKPDQRRAFGVFAKRYRDWMRDLNKYDYTGVLELAVENSIRLPVSHLIVDEAQDLSPLQTRAMLPTIASAQMVVVAGDDDQAIFEHAGSDPGWLLSMADNPNWDTTILDQSWRVPAVVHLRAQRVIARNRRRVSKVYRPRKAKGAVNWLRWSDVVSHATDGTLCLARTRWGVAPIAMELYRAGLPYIIERGMGPNPLGRPELVGAVKTATKIAAGDNISAEDLVGLLNFIPSSRTGDAGLAPWGVKTKVAGIIGEICPADLSMLGLGNLVIASRRDPIDALIKLGKVERDYLRRLRATYGEVPKPTIRLSTIHSVKGQEANNVIISTEIPRIVSQSMSHGSGESENRVAYVALTRARESVGLIWPKGRYSFSY